MDIKDKVISRLLVLNRRAIAKELATKTEDYSRKMLKAREFKNLEEYLIEKSRFFDADIRPIMTSENVVYSQMVEMVSRLTASLLEVCAVEGILVASPIITDLWKSVVFEDIQRTIQAFQKFRYYMSGNNFKSYKEFLATIGVEHPDFL